MEARRAVTRLAEIIASLALAATVALSLGGCAAEASTETMAPPASAESTAATEAPVSNGPELAAGVVERVVDGDTAHIRLEDSTLEKVRFIGVDTPESTKEVEAYGKEASAFTTRELLGKSVWLELDVEERDRYGRLLAYVWLERPADRSDAEIRAKMFNARLALEGYAQQMTIAPNVRYAEWFRVYVAEARDASRGLWATGAGETSTGSGSSASGTGGSSAGSSAGSKVPATSSYIANSNTRKFHRNDCRYGPKISPQNRVKYDSRDDAVADGYVPCKVCRP